MTFLVAEDNRRMRESIIRCINGKIPDHHTFHEAADGSEAVTLYHSVLPDCVVMDIEMEPMDGLTASINILKNHPAAKIVILTSYDDARYRNAAAQAGVWAYVLKDQMNELIELIASL
ncbi:MAG: response regulator [Bacteroidota bacterium]